MTLQIHWMMVISLLPSIVWPWSICLRRMMLCQTMSRCRQPDFAFTLLPFPIHILPLKRRPLVFTIFNQSFWSANYISILLSLSSCFILWGSKSFIFFTYFPQTYDTWTIINLRIYNVLVARPHSLRNWLPELWSSICFLWWYVPSDLPNLSPTCMARLICNGNIIHIVNANWIV